LSNDLERPLGQTRNAGASPRSFSGRQIFLGLVSASVVCLSTFLAFQRDKVSEPLPVEVAAVSANKAPEESKTTEAPDKKPAVAEEVAVNQPPQALAGPKIIKVKREDTDITGGIAKVRDPGQLTQDPRMAHVPEKALLESSDYGMLPVKAEDGRRPVDVYARPWTGSRGAKVAIIVGGLGISQTSTQRAIRDLPPEVTLAFAPQGNSLSRWVQTARRNGHEILLQIPMEPFDYPNVDPGRGTLLVDADAVQNLGELHRSLGRITNYSGVLNYMGARFTADAAAMKPVIADLAERGLMFVDDGSSARSLAASMMKDAKGAYASGNLVIDGIQDKNEILKKLDELEASARASGSAIATATAFDVTVEAVAEWSEEAKKRGIEIVGVSALAEDPEK
jgi:uncharacterized protein